MSNTAITFRIGMKSLAVRNVQSSTRDGDWGDSPKGESWGTFVGHINQKFNGIIMTIPIMINGTIPSNQEFLVTQNDIHQSPAEIRKEARRIALNPEMFDMDSLERAIDKFCHPNLERMRNSRIKFIINEDGRVAINEDGETVHPDDL